MHYISAVSPYMSINMCYNNAYDIINTLICTI